MRRTHIKNITHSEPLRRYHIEPLVGGVCLYNEKVEIEAVEVVHRFVFGNRKATERTAELQVQSTSGAQGGRILHAADKRKD